MIPSVPELAILTVIVLLVFGSGRIRTLGSDIGGAWVGLKSGFKGDAKLEEFAESVEAQASNTVKRAARDTVEAVTKQS